MIPETDRFLQAFRSRDPRFDGRFFVGVRTTGIYCRPVCRARPPKAENIGFYSCAAAAEEAGYRPCRRCRPETAPGTPAWNGSSTTVGRALRLIQDGALDGHGVASLASRLGVGERHLRRLFSLHLGASPLAVARTRRVHFARRLIDETSLPMTRVAESAGFSSVRQFNDEILRTFHAPPTELRHGRRAPGNGESAGILALRLPYRPPLDWEMLSGYLGPRAMPGVEAVDGSVYRRTVRVGSRPGWIEVAHVPGEAHLLLRMSISGAPGVMRAAERVRRIFDLSACPDGIAEHLARDPRLQPLVRARPGLRVPGAWDPFELAVRAILGQQVSVRGATTLAGRLVRAFGAPLGDAPHGLTHLFPLPGDLAEADIAALGMPEKRAEAIRALSRAVAAGRLDLQSSPGLDEAMERLQALPGLGPWTAAYVAMRCLGEPDAFPAEDLGVRKALADGGPLPSARAVRAVAEAWRPWRAYAVLHLWMSAPAAVAGKAPRRMDHASGIRARRHAGRPAGTGRR